MTNPPVDLSEFLSGFLAEAEELLRKIKAHLMELDAATEREQPAPRAARELFRAVHTIKGLAAMVGVEPIVEIAHVMESVLREIERAGGQSSAGAVEPLIEGAQAIEQRVNALSEGSTAAPPPKALLQRLSSLEPTRSGGAFSGEVSLEAAVLAKLGPAERGQLQQALADGRRVVRADFVPTAERTARGISITSVRERLGALGEIIKVVPLSVARTGSAPGGLRFALLLATDADDAAVADACDGSVEQVHAVTRTPPVEPAVAAEEPVEGGRSRVVRVDVERLDAALEGLSELVIGRFRIERALQELTAGGADTRALAQAVAEQSRELKRLRGAILRLRLVPVTELLEPLPLIVRGLRAKTGKAVELHVERSAAELDKSVAERIFPAIVHLVRNAVDHGLEAPEERRRAGKPETGRVGVRCVELTNAQLEISVSDDGRGIDRGQLAERAGRPVPNDDAELLELLARPGFSTREQVTTTSGRGFGVDIARRLVDTLGGELELSTSVGQGTTFTLRIPITVSIVDAITFECASQRFVAPVSTVDEIVEVSPAELTRPPTPGGRQAVASLIERRGRPVPLLDLAALLRLPRRGDAPACKALVVRSDAGNFGFLVHQLLGHQEVVQRPLEDPLVRVPGVSGATDLGDGTPTLVLDLLALTRALRSREAA